MASCIGFALRPSLVSAAGSIRLRLKEGLQRCHRSRRNFLDYGLTEGQINRPKAIKLQMYGRAGFLLLRARVLPYQAMAPLTWTESSPNISL